MLLQKVVRSSGWKNAGGGEREAGCDGWIEAKRMDFEKQCREIEKTLEKLEKSMGDPAVAGNREKSRRAAKAHRDLTRVVEKWRERQRVAHAREEAAALAGDPDPEMAEMARAEMKEMDALLPVLERELKLLLLPADPMDGKNTVMEIRAGTGGEEAALFAGDLLRAYMRYAETQGWKTDVLSSHPTGLGGFKEVIFGIEGQNVYSRLKFESGIHRVQRVPITEASGRIHTSAITVAVMPEADEVDVEIKPEDIRIDVFRSTGPGGQSVNTTDSAVRITHFESGLVVSCQDEKSQHKNRAKALKVLRSRLYDRELARRQSEESEARRQQVGSGDRSGRIRTYNFPQNRLTDHRIGLTLYRLDQIMEGDFDDVFEALAQDEQRRKLEGLGNSNSHAA